MIIGLYLNGDATQCNSDISHALKGKHLMNLIKKFLEKLACHHEWHKYYAASYHVDDDVNPYAGDIFYVCKICGKFKKLKIRRPSF